MKFCMQCEICHSLTGCLQLFNGTVYSCPKCYLRETKRHEKKRGLFDDLQKGTTWKMEFEMSPEDARKFFHLGNT